MFKERFFIFHNVPEGTPEGTSEELAKIRERLAIIEKALGLRKDLEDEHSHEATDEAPLNRSDLITRILDRIQPDNIEKFVRMIPAIAEDLEQGHIEKILNLTERCSEKDLVFDKITTFIDLSIINVSNLSHASIAILIRNQKEKPEQIKILFDNLLANWATAEYTIAACENDSELLKTLYEAMSGSRVLKQLQPKHIGILIDGFQKEGNETKIKEIFGKFFDNYFDTEKLIKACAASGEKEKNLQLLANEITKSTHKTLLASLRGDALAAFSVSVEAFAKIMEKITWEQQASMLSSSLLSDGWKLKIFKKVFNSNQEHTGDHPEFAAPLVEFAHTIKDSDKGWYAKLVDRLERNPATINALMTGSTVSAPALGTLFNSLSAEIREKVTAPPTADISLFKILHEPELVERKIRETCIPEGFITERDPEGNILIKMTAAVRKLPEGLSISDFPQCKLTLDKTGEKITFNRGRYAEFTEKEQVFNAGNANTMATTIQGDLDAITSTMVEYHELYHLPTEEEVTAARVAKDEAMDGFEFNEANWKKISTHGQIKGILTADPFTENEESVISTTADIVEEDDNADIDIDEVFEYSKVFAEVTKLREYTDEFGEPDPNSPEAFLKYFNWLKDSLDKESKSENPQTTKIIEYKRVLAEMHAVYKQSDRFMQMIVHADVLSDADVQVIEGIRAAKKGAPVPPIEPPAPEPAAAEEPVPGPEAPAPTPEAPAPPEAPTPSREPITKLEESITSLTGESLAKAMLEKAGYKFGDNISWTEAGSERSFIKTDKYLAELTRRNTDDTLVHDSIESIHLLNAGWLMRIIIQDGSIDTNAHNVTNHIESNISLINSITKYEAITPNEFAEGTTFEEMIDRTPGIVIYREKEIRFYFPIKDAAGKRLSRRSFNITDEFKKALLAAKPNNSLKVRKFCYEWLLKIIEADGSKADPTKSKVIEAAKSNEHLELEIARIEGIKDLPSADEAARARREAPPAPEGEEGAAEGEGEEAAEGAEEAEATPDPLQEILRTYFGGTGTIEVSNRKIATGDYQIVEKPKDKAYTEYGAFPPVLTFSFMKITDPIIYKLTKGTETKYLVKVNFHRWDDRTNSVQSTSTQSGFVNIDDLATGHGADRRALAAIESDFTRNTPDQIHDDAELDTTLTYKAHNDIQLHTGTDHRSTLYPKTSTITVLEAKSRSIEGQDYVKVKVSDGTLTEEGWMLKSNLDIPGEYTTWFDSASPSTTITEASRNTVTILGTFDITSKIQGKDLLPELFRKFPTLEAKFTASKLTKAEYLTILASFRDNNTLHIVEPEKSFKQRMTEFKESATTTAFETAMNRIRDDKFTARNTETFKPTYVITDQPELVTILGDEAEWAKLWAKEPPYEHTYIEGMEAITDAFQKLGLKDIEVRDVLQKIMTEWSDEEVTFEEIFEMLLEDKNYKGDFDDFKEELDTLERETSSWRGTFEGGKIARIEAHERKRASIQFHLEQRGAAFRNTNEYRLWQTQEAEMKPLLKVYFGNGGEDSIKYKLDRLEHLRTTMFEPIDKLLNAIVNLHLASSTPETTLDKYADTFATLPAMDTTAYGTVATRGLFDLESVINQPRFELIESAPAGKIGITLTPAIEIKFDNIIKAAITAAGRTPGNWNNRDLKLKLLFNLYSLDTLIKEGCLQRKTAARNNELVLVKLPESFKADDPRIQEVATRVLSDEDVITQIEHIREVAKRLDANTAALNLISQVFSTDKGLSTHYNWTEVADDYLFCGPDTTERILTMSDIGSGKVTEPTEDLLKQTMSDSAARTRLLGAVTKFENGVETYDLGKIKEKLKRKLKLGISTLFIHDRFKNLRDRVLGALEFPTREAHDNAVTMAYDRLAIEIDTFNGNLSQDTKDLIRIGEIADSLIEANEDIPLSTSPEIRAIQEELLKKGFPAHKLQKVEEKFLGGLAIDVTTPAVGGHVVLYDFGDGWKLGGQLAVGAPGAGGGLDISKTFTFTENGDTRLTIGIEGGYLYLGGRADVRFPIGDTYEGGAFAIGGGWALGFYAGGGVIFGENMDKKHQEAFKEEMKLKGFTETQKLIDDGASAEAISASIRQLPVYGEKFDTLKTEFHLNDRAMIALFGNLRDKVETQVTKDTDTDWPSFIIPHQVGAFGGLVSGLPAFGGIISIKVGEEFVDIRSVMPGYENVSELSDRAITAQLEQSLGRKVTNLLRVTTGDTGHLIIDPVSGNIAVLESAHEVNLGVFDELEQSQEALADVDIELLARPGNLYKLKINNSREAQANTKVLIDPNQPDVEAVVRNGELLIRTEDLSKLIITREDFYYLADKDGQTSKYTVVTIKTNPYRTREMIERESINVAYKSADHKFEIRNGISTVGSPKIVSETEYVEYGFTAPEAITTFDEEKFQEWRTAMRAALGSKRPEVVNRAPREGIVPGFADKFFDMKDIQFEGKKHTMAKVYRLLSTIGQEKYDETALIKLITEKAATEGFTDLTDRELNEIMIHLATKSFMDASGHPTKTREQIAEINLKFAEGVFTKFFDATDVRAAVGSTNPTAAEMAAALIADLRKTNLDENPDPNIEAGTIFASIVGTMRIKGLRSIPYYGSELDKGSGIIGLHKYQPGAEGVKGAIGRAVLQILSPIDTTDDAKLMESPLAMKLASMGGLYVILGHDDCMKLAQCFKDKRVDTENTAAFNRFKDLVVKVRDAQNKGQKTITIGEYELKVSTDISVGLYKKCTNPSLLATESVALLTPKRSLATTAARQDTRVTASSVNTKRPITMSVAILGTDFDEKGDKQAGEGGGEKPAEHKAAANNSETVTTGEPSGGTATVGEKPQSPGGDGNY